MSQNKASDPVEVFGRLMAGMTKKKYVLHLYITGSTPQSLRAIANIRRICENYLHGAYRLDVTDLYQEPELARRQQIIAAPTLIKESPLPVRRILGDMSQTDRVLVGLGLRDSL